MTTAKTVGGAATRQALLDASYTLFTARGYHATSMRDIAAATGITAGSIYNHFADKEQIVQEVLLAYHPFMKVLPVLEGAEGQTVFALVHDAAHRIMHEIDAAPGVLNLVAIELVELKGVHLQALVETMYPLVQGFLALFGLFGITMDLLGYFAGIGAWGELFRNNPMAVGVVEAHGLALILAVLLLRHAAASETGVWHLTAVAVHLLLGICNLLFWQVFVTVNLVPLGIVATVYHFIFVIANGVALLWRNRISHR